MSTNTRNRIIEVVGAVVTLVLSVLGCFYNSAFIIFGIAMCVFLIAILKDRSLLRIAFTAIIAELVGLETLGILSKQGVIKISIFADRLTSPFIIDIFLIFMVIVYGYVCTRPKDENAKKIYERFIAIKQIFCYILLIIAAVYLIAALVHSKEDTYAFEPKDGERILILPCNDTDKAVTVFDRMDIRLGEKNYEEQQVFLLRETGNGYYNIQAYNEENVLDINMNIFEVGNDIIEWFNLDAPNQKWRFSYIDGHGYAMNSEACDYLYMSVGGENENMVLSEWTGYNNHFFIIEKYSVMSGLFEISEYRGACITLLVITIVFIFGAVVLNYGKVLFKKNIRKRAE